jgi:hypothetical protein
MAEKRIICPQCRSPFLAEWKRAKWSMVHSFKCPACGIELHVTGAPLHPFGFFAQIRWEFGGSYKLSEAHPPIMRETNNFFLVMVF